VQAWEKPPTRRQGQASPALQWGQPPFASRALKGAAAPHPAAPFPAVDAHPRKTEFQPGLLRVAFEVHSEVQQAAPTEEQQLSAGLLLPAGLRLLRSVD